MERRGEDTGHVPSGSEETGTDIPGPSATRPERDDSGEAPERDSGRQDVRASCSGQSDNPDRDSLVRVATELRRLRSSAAYRLGRAQVEALKDWRLFITLPLTVFRIWRDVRNRRLGTQSAAGSDWRDHAGPDEGLPWPQAIEIIHTEQGADQAERYITAQRRPGHQKADGFFRLARLELNHDVRTSARLARKALELDDRAYRRERYAFLFFDAGCVREAAGLLGRSTWHWRRGPSEAAKIRQIQGSARLLETLPEIPGRVSQLAFDPRPKSVLYVASSSLPYHVTGYTQRTHALLKALVECGMDMHCVTRPGYPKDCPDVQEVDDGAVHVVEGITYETLPGVHRREVRPDEYIGHSAAAIEYRARELRPAVIHAASNHEAGLPALIAARRLGIPFVYEVRGLWEYTAASKRPNWEETERFQFEARLESLAVQHADHVLTLTQALADELRRRGPVGGEITLAPNAVHPEEFSGLSRDRALARETGLEDAQFVVGYVGAIVKYEGLDDLLAAASMLRGDHPGLRVLIVGGGDYLDRLRDLASTLGIADICMFTGRVSPEDAKRYLALLDTVALPRKPYPVCQLVSPLKPMEAMAAGIPLVVSDVAALKEMVVDGQTALVHRAGDPQSLGSAIRSLIEGHELRAAMAAQGRNRVSEHQRWTRVAERICSTYAQVINADSSRR